MGAGFVDGFAVVFGVIGGLELVDRTSFALIALASRNHRALPTWFGGAVAFGSTTVLAVLIGVAFEAGLGPGRIELLRVGGGSFLVAYAAWVYAHPEEGASAPAATAPGTAFAATFLTIFLLELGDTTMVFEVVFVTSLGWMVVLIAGALALVSVAAWDVWLGRRLGAWLEPESLRKMVVVVLVLVGVLTIAYGLSPSTFGRIAAGL